MSPLFTLLWGGLDNADAVAAGIDEDGWYKLSRLAEQQRLRPLLHQRSLGRSWPVPPKLARQWQNSYNRAAMRALGQRAVLLRIGALLATANIRTAVLKGGALAWASGSDPALRPMRDLDLLIAPEDAGGAIAALSNGGFSGGGTELLDSGKHLPAMTMDRVTVELHLHLFDTYDAEAAESERQFIARAWQRAEPTFAPGICALCPTDTLLHLILHAVLDHQFNNGPLLLSDLAALTRSGTIDWPLFWSEAARLDVLRACHLALGAGQQLAGIEVEWCDQAPAELDARRVEQVARLMLVDTVRRSAVGWPGQLLRLPLRRWPGQLLAMFRRRAQRGAGDSSNGAGLRSALSLALGSQGRAEIADSADLARWLRRNS